MAVLSSPEKAALATLIAERLASGLYHPGDPETEQEPMMMRLPMFRTIGAPPEMHKQVDLTTLLIAESIVYLIEKDGNFTLVPCDGEGQDGEAEGEYQPFGSTEVLRQIAEGESPDEPTEEPTEEEETP